MRIAPYHGKGAGRAVVSATALAIVALLGAIGSAGWGWAVAAWFGSSAVTFAACAVWAGRAAREGERSERQLLDEGPRRSSGIERRAGAHDVGRR